MKALQPMKTSTSVVALLFAATTASFAHAQGITGNIHHYQENAIPALFTFGDGVHSVTLSWSIQSSTAGFFYTGFGDTEVALANGVSSIDQITDASAFSFTPWVTEPVSDVTVTGGLNSFVILRNRNDGFYGVIRVDDITQYNTPLYFDTGNGSYYSNGDMDATWWFQPDGTANFSTSAIPEPSTYAAILAVVSAGVVLLRRRARVAAPQTA